MLYRSARGEAQTVSARSTKSQLPAVRDADDDPSTAAKLLSSIIEGSSRVQAPAVKAYVDRLRSLGLVATTSPQGAGKWALADRGALAGRHVGGIGPLRQHPVLGVDEDHARRVVA